MEVSAYGHPQWGLQGQLHREHRSISVLAKRSVEPRQTWEGILRDIMILARDVGQNLFSPIAPQKDLERCKCEKIP